MMPSGMIIVYDEMKRKMWPETNLRLYPESSLAGKGGKGREGRLIKTTKDLTNLFIEE